MQNQPINPQDIDYKTLAYLKYDVCLAPGDWLGKPYHTIPKSELRDQLRDLPRMSILWIRARYHLARRGGLDVTAHENACWILQLACLKKNRPWENVNYGGRA